MKQVILMRTDLGMSAGKMCAQVAHLPSAGNYAAVVLAVNSLEELEDLHAKAVKAGITSSYVTDAGKTEVEPGTVTCASIGPDDDAKINKIVGQLKKL